MIHRSVNHGADISKDGKYRYLLWREWKHSGFVKPATRTTALFIMLNPSTADGSEDDPTVRRCINFARSWGHSRLEVVNLFAYRATDPKQLMQDGDVVGPENDTYLKRAAERADVIVCAWGALGWIDDRAVQVRALLVPMKHKTFALGFTRGNHPKHPLYLAADTRLVPV